MSDIIDRAEAALVYDSWIGHPAAVVLLRELVAELKVARAERDQLQDKLNIADQEL